MNAQKNSGRKPDYSSYGVAVWVNKNKSGKTYLAIKIVGHDTLHAFEQEAELAD